MIKSRKLAFHIAEPVRKFFLFGKFFLVNSSESRNFHPHSLRQYLHRLHIGNVFYILHELYYVAACAATETLEYFPSLFDVERSRLFVMKRTSPPIRTAFSREIHVAANNVQDVVFINQLFDKLRKFAVILTHILLLKKFGLIYYTTDFFIFLYNIINLLVFLRIIIVIASHLRKNYSRIKTAVI